jgi:hypothetical protein
MIITNFFIRRKIRKLSRSSSLRPHHFCPLDKAKHILLLCERSELGTAEYCIQTLKNEGKSVETVVYFPPEKDQEWQGRDSFFLFHGKTHLSRWGFPMAEIVRSISALPADILIDLSHSESYAMRYIALQHPSRFKIGLKRPSDPDMYDFSITFTEDNTKKQLFDVIMYYLRTIQIPSASGGSVKH